MRSVGHDMEGGRVSIVTEAMVVAGLQQGESRIRREGSLWPKSPL